MPHIYFTPHFEKLAVFNITHENLLVMIFHFISYNGMSVYFASLIFSDIHMVQLDARKIVHRRRRMLCIMVISVCPNCSFEHRFTRRWSRKKTGFTCDWLVESHRYSRLLNDIGVGRRSLISPSVSVSMKHSYHPPPEEQLTTQFEFLKLANDILYGRPDNFSGAISFGSCA